MEKIRPCLWFDSNAEEAVRFYTSVFKNSRIVQTVRYGDAASKGAQRPKGSVMTIVFELEGQSFMALNGGPVFKFSPAISLMVGCDTQPELDELWEKLSAGGEKQECGWLADKYGVSWQIVPARIGELHNDNELERSDRVMRAVLGMSKLDIAAIERAYAGTA